MPRHTIREASIIHKNAAEVARLSAELTAAAHGSLDKAALSEVIRLTQLLINEATEAYLAAQYSMGDMQAVA